MKVRESYTKPASASRGRAAGFWNYQSSTTYLLLRGARVCLRLSLRQEVDEAFPQRLAVVPGGDSQQARSFSRCSDGGLRCSRNGRQVAAVDDDLHDRPDARRQPRMLAKLLAQSRAILGIGAG